LYSSPVHISVVAMRWQSSVDSWKQSRIMSKPSRSTLNARNGATLPPPQLNRGIALQKIGRYEEPIADYERADQNFADLGQRVGVAPSQLNRGFALENLGSMWKRYPFTSGPSQFSLT